MKMDRQRWWLVKSPHSFRKYSVLHLCISLVGVMVTLTDEMPTALLEAAVGVAKVLVIHAYDYVHICFWLIAHFVLAEILV